MNFFATFTPIAPRSPIDDAMKAYKTIQDNSQLMGVYDAIMALPDEERAVVVDLMRALPNLIAPDSEGRQWGKGDIVRRRLEKFINDPRRVRDLTDILKLADLFAEELAEVGFAAFIPDMDEEVPRARRFGPERS